MTVTEQAMCRECGENEAKWTGGPLRGLCVPCAQPIRDRMSESQRRRSPGSTENGDLPQSYEAKAKVLVSAGKRIDQAVRRHNDKKKQLEPLAEEVKQALTDWRTLLRKMAGENDS